MSEIANTIGLPYEFDYKGRVVKVAPRCFEVEGYFSVWAESLGLKVLQRHQESLSVAEYDLLMNGWRRDCQQGAYDFGEVACWRVALGEAGRKKLAALQINKAGGITLPQAEEFVEEVWADKEGRRRLEEVVERANADPNRPRPWRKKSGA